MSNELPPEMEKELNEIGKKMADTMKKDREALWMPAGSVRSILAIMVVGAAIAFIYFQKPIPEWYAVIAGIILRDYFAGGTTRDTSKLLNGRE